MTIRAEEEEETKLHAAVRLHNLKLVRAALRDEGLEIDALGTYGWTALHEASSYGYLDIVILLLDNGANPNIQDSFQKCSPLHLAARNGHLEVVRSLVQGGARLDLRNAEGKIPQNYANEECREFLKRKRIEDVIKLNPSPVEDGRSLNKLYGQRSSHSPVLQKVRQSSPQWSESSQSSIDSMSSNSSGSSESFCASSTALYQPGPGEIKVALDFNRARHTLIVRLEEIRDVKLPAEHNMSHIYIKCYIVPDQRKATKHKTSLFPLVWNDGVRSSRDSVTSWSTEENDCGKRSEKGVGQRFVSSLKRGTRLSSKKKRGQDQVTSMPEMVPIYRISTTITETFRYDSVHLRKVNFDTANVLLMVCGRNRVTMQSQPVACVTVPLTSCGRVSTPEWFPLVYRIMLPNVQEVEIHQSLSQTKSWDQQGEMSTRRSSAWNEPTMSNSMPNIDFATSSAATSQTFPRTSQGAESGFPADGSKKYKKHSGASKMFRKEFKLMKGKGNFRYKNSAAKQESDDGIKQEENVVDSLCNDDLEVLSPSTLPPRPNHASDLNRTLREQNRDIGNKLRDLPKNRMHDSRRSNLENSLCDDESPEVIDLVEEPSSRPELEHRSSFAGSLKYSRAFQQKNTTSHRRDVVLHDVECEDVEEISDAPFAVTNFYGRKSGIACN